MNRYLLILMLTLFTIGVGMAQDIESELDFKYIKAKYLLDTERYEDAIKAFTEIIKEKPGFNDALELRAQAKYAMAAYRGTKNDIVESTGYSGMTLEGLVLLGKADYKLGNATAALNSLKLADMAGTEDLQVLEIIGNIYKEEGKLLIACEYWQRAAKKGSSKARINSKKICGSTEPTEDPVKTSPKPKSKIDKFPKKKTDDVEVEKEDKTEDTETKTTSDKDDTLTNPTRDSVLKNNKTKPKVEEEKEPEDEMGGSMDEVEENENMPEEDDFPNDIEIDEDLSLVIRGQGLGRRKVLDQPNILIISDEDGKVAIDICVNSRGKVESAEFNGKLSTIAKKSLVSLAIRKSKEFWFEKNDYKEQCGVIIFDIKS